MFRKQRKLFIVLPLVLLCILLFIIFSYKSESTQPETSVPLPAVKKAATGPDSNHNKQEKPSEKHPVLVDVKGEVRNPGVYKMESSARVVDAINKAGGFNNKAAKDTVNLAQRVQDEMVIVIAKEGEEPAAFAQQSSGIAASNDQTTALVNINRADQAELETLPGIGPSKAQAILQYREENGPFANPEALMEVTGIGQKSFETLKDVITVD